MPRFTRRLAVAGASALAVLAGLLGVAPATSAAAAGRSAPSAGPASLAAASTSAGVQPGAPGTVVPLPATRLLDTRNRTGGAGPATAAHPVVTFPVLGRGGVPASGVASVMLTVTVTGPTAAGFVAHDGLSSLNFAPAQTVANLVLLPVAADGTASLTVYSSGTTQVLADLAGYVRAGGATTSGALKLTQQERIVDTRPSVIPARGSITFATGGYDVDQLGGGAWLNITVTGAASAGYLTARPDGAPETATSVLNFTAGQTVANTMLVRPGGDGSTVITNNSSGSVALIVDLHGVVLGGEPSADGATAAVSPERVLDTRRALGASGPVAAGATVRLPVAGVAGVPTSGVSAVVLNLTVTTPTGAGFVTAYADGASRPGTSVLNYPPGRTVADTVVVPVGADGAVALTAAGSGTVQLLADIEGYVHTASPPPSVTWRQTLPVTPVSTNLALISCPTRSFCMAEDRATNRTSASGSMFRTYDGATWSPPVPAPLETGMISRLSCASASFCTATDFGGRLWSWDGRSWQMLTVAPLVPGDRLEFSSLSCPSASFCMAVDDDEGAVVTWNGSVWSAATDAAGVGPLRDVSCSSDTFCLAVGYQASFNAVYDGSSWQRGPVAPASGSRNVTLGLSCVSPTYCVVLVSSGQTPYVDLSMVFDGQAWQAPQASTLPPRSGQTIQCVAVGFCMAMNDGPVYQEAGDRIAVLDGTSWSIVDPDPGTADAKGVGMVSVSCPDPQRCLATDSAGRVLVGEGSTWSATSPLPTKTGVLDDVACADPVHCFAVTGFGSVLSYDGTTWSPPATIALGRQLAAVSCGGASSCVAVDDDGGVVTWDGSVWSDEQVVDAGHSLTSLSCWAPGACVAGDEAGGILTETDGTWGPRVSQPGAGGTVHEVSCVSASFCLSVTDGQLVVGDHGHWQVDSQMTTFLSDGLACSSQLCLVSNESGDLFQVGPNDAGSPFMVGGGSGLDDVSCTRSGRCVSLSGTVMSGDLAGSAWTLPSSAPLTGKVACVDPGLCVATSPDSLAVATLG